MSRSMRQRLPLYHSLHRSSSHPLSTLAVSPPSTSRPVLSSPPRLPSEAPKQSQHSQLALTQPSPAIQQAPLFPYSPPILAPAFALTPAAGPSAAAVPHTTPEIPRAHKRARLQYQLDVGAYGIPKSRPAPSTTHHHHRSFHSRPAPPLPHTHRSVQVGEDAYFVTPNALGIADGVGGWARVTPHAAQHQQYPTPSALFSRRLMHFCAAELEALDASTSSTASSSTTVPAATGVRPPTTTRFSFEHHLKPRPAPPAPIRPESYTYAFTELEESLEELEDGIDVLQIMERAYDSTVRAHIAPSSSPTSPTPLTTGSSTALLAVLDHPPSGQLKQNPEPPHRNYAAGSIPMYNHQSSSVPVEPTQSVDQAHTDASIEAKSVDYDAVVHIAHLGDCMGMLVRGDEIVWRSDEMWWGYNHPLQLGPPAPGTFPTNNSSSTAKSTPSSSSSLPSSASQSSTPSSTASSTATSSLIPLPVQPHTFMLPVRADDILILASDGLGDNLWDEDVLDEVLRVKDTIGLTTATSTSTPADAALHEVPSTAGMMEGLRKAFAGLDVGEGVSAATASASPTAYPSPPASDSPSPVASSSRASSPLPSFSSSSKPTPSFPSTPASAPSSSASGARRKAFAGTLAEALCSRAKCVSERRGAADTGRGLRAQSRVAGDVITPDTPVAPGEVPFGRRAALEGRVFRGGKCDDISVIVAVISPSPLPEPTQAAGGESMASDASSAEVVS
ncbi:hypothetical protein BDN70DRAFT_887695 [Pholiota conissans]|uniref:Protein phosphatase n=1 Tax=Pholiota conissans TaxID=109636 RepID=A0A9P6CTQ1_9AGAR|nr:hypothetical protein BDN70DRAFT_887695 [Pholiota conissans]